MATVTERLALVIEANAGQAIASIKQVGTAAKGLQGDVGKAGGALSTFGKSGGGALQGLVGSLGFAAATAGIAKFATDGISSLVDLATEVRNFQDIAGGTTESASRLIAAFSAVGVDATTAATGVFQLEKHLATGAEKLAAFGVVAVKDKQGNTDMAATLLRVGDAYKNITDPAQRAALLTAAFGKSGAALAPLLARSRAEIEGFFAAAAKSGKILSPQDTADAIKYQLAIHDLQQAFTGLEEEAGKALIPLLASVAKSDTEVLTLIGDIGNLVGKIGQIPGIPNLDLKKKLGIDTSVAGFIANPLGTIAGAVKQVVTGAIEGFPKATGAATGFADELGAVASALTGVGPSAADDFSNLEGAIQGAADADRALADAQHSQSDAQSAYNKLLAQGAIDLQKVADAETSVAEAGRSLGHAQREQAKAQGEYNDALAAFNLLGTDTARAKLVDATNNLADANDSVANAQDSVNKANTDLATAKAGDPDYQTKLADAKQKVADATQNMSDKALADVTAHNKETTAMSDYADQLDRVLADYTAIAAQYPATALALAPFIAAAGGAVAPPLASVTPPAPPPPTPGPILGPAVPSAGPVQPVTFNNTFNTPVDPAAIAKQFVWQLGG